MFADTFVLNQVDQAESYKCSSQGQPPTRYLRNIPAQRGCLVLLCLIVDYCADGMHPMVTRDSIYNGLFDTNGYTFSIQAKSNVQRVIGRAWKALEDARLPSAEGRSEPAATDYMGFRMRSKFSRDMFHPALPDAAWNAFTVGDCDSAALMKKAFDPDDGPLRDKATPYTTSKTA